MIHYNHEQLAADSKIGIENLRMLNHLHGPKIHKSVGKTRRNVYVSLCKHWGDQIKLLEKLQAYSVSELTIVFLRKVTEWHQMNTDYLEAKNVSMSRKPQWTDKLDEDFVKYLPLINKIYVNIMDTAMHLLYFQMHQSRRCPTCEGWNWKEKS